MKNYIVIFCVAFTFFSCKEQTVLYQANDCKRPPSFIKNVGFDPSRSVFSTSEKRIKGLALVETNTKGDTSNGGRKIYQHPSWTTQGYMGPILLDPQGNCYVAPVPVINLIDNPISKQNIIYKIDSQTGEMAKFEELPLKDTLGIQNPYGILGFAYLCESNILYVSSVQGSTREKENGVIYAIDESGKIIDKLDNIDAFGLGISFVNDSRKLYFGSARVPNIYQIRLSEEGKFIGKPTETTSIADFGPRGDDKARKIRFDKNGNMEVYTLEFNYNLTAPTEKQENKLVFSWDEEKKTWQCTNN
jgi:hypothetical protein